VRQKLEAARDYVKSKEWDQAVHILQDLLEAKEDLFLPPVALPPAGKPAVSARGVRAEAYRLLDTLPPKGLETYNAVFGAKASALLKDADDRDDLHLLTQVVQRYRHTAPGAEAAERLGTYHLDRGNRDLAARCFALLLGRPEAAKPAPLTLYKAAVAFRLAGDAARAEQAWKALADQVPDGLAVGGQVRALDRLRADLDLLGTEPPARDDWAVYRGDIRRTGRGDGDVPLLDPVWKKSTVPSGRVQEWIERGIKAQERAGRLLLPGFYPIAVPGRIVYRSHGGIHAIDAASGAEVWQLPSPLSLRAIAADSGMAVTGKNWLQNVYGDAAHFPLENSALGCLSTDGQRVYAVEDLAVPPPPEAALPAQPGMPAPGGPRELVAALSANRLRAIDLDTGKITGRGWETDGRSDLQKCFFLGAPLPVAGRLYALVDKDGEIRLVCLEPTSGAVLWTQRLGSTPGRLALDPGRRLRGVQMTYADGLLLCPTDAGAVFAFDLFTSSLAWVYLYPSQKLPQETGMVFNLAAFNTSWRESAPVVAGGKLVFTAGDSDEVHCVALRDGKPVWQAVQAAHGYLAGVFGDRVLLVGAGGARALSLSDGKPAWASDLGVPSGQGAASGNVYYLPLKTARETAGPGVAALDPATGKLLAFAPSRGGEVPGNLIFFGGQVISQTATALTAYPQLKVRLRRVEELLAADPRNPRGLAERGTLRLDRGDVPGALADLRAARAVSLPGPPEREAEARLHEALKQAVQRDFAAGEKYLAEFEASCRLPVPKGATVAERGEIDTERQRREANYLLVLARGREGQGRLPEALAAYARLHTQADRVFAAWNGPDVGWRPFGKPTAASHSAQPAATTPPQAWIQGHVIDVLARARPEQRAGLDREIARQWRALPAADLDALGRFVALFGAAGRVELEARLTYAERLASEQARGRYLEAELHLLALQRQRDEPQVAARALLALARLLTEKGQADDALYYYRQLAGEFPTTPVRDGKTGGDFLRELALDKRFIPLLDDPWAGRKFKTAEVRGLFPPRGILIGMEPEGESPPCLRRQRLAFDVYGGKLKLFDRNTGAELWSQSVVGTGHLRLLLGTAPPQGWIPYRADGHLAVVSLGHMAYGIDLLERRLLWTRDLGEPSMPSVLYLQIDDERQHIKIQYQDGVIQPLGRIAPIQPAGVALTLRGKLIGLDPLSGTLLWTMPLNDPLAELFADDQYVYATEGRPPGAPDSQRAVSLRGGVARAPVGDLPLAPGKPIQAVGRNLLVSMIASNRTGRLMLYDALAGKEVWTQPLAKGTLVARSEVSHLTATVGRDGQVRVYDLRRRAELFQAQVDQDLLRGVHEVRLFQDRWHYYLLLNRELRGRDGVAGPALPNAIGGIRSLPANGSLYAFHRTSGALHWASEVKTQQLLLEQIEDSPVLLFSALLQRTPAGPAAPAPGPVFTVTSIDKQTGKVLWLPKDYASITSPVHRVEINPATGTIDMISKHWKMRHVLVE